VETPEVAQASAIEPAVSAIAGVRAIESPAWIVRAPAIELAVLVVRVPISFYYALPSSIYRRFSRQSNSTGSAKFGPSETDLKPVVHQQLGILALYECN
jgi:hypothetical protein